MASCPGVGSALLLVAFNQICVLRLSKLLNFSSRIPHHKTMWLEISVKSHFSSHIVFYVVPFYWILLGRFLPHILSTVTGGKVLQEDCCLEGYTYFTYYYGLVRSWDWRCFWRLLFSLLFKSFSRASGWVLVSMLSWECCLLVCSRYLVLMSFFDGTFSLSSSARCCIHFQ